LHFFQMTRMGDSRAQRLRLNERAF
jgi:hypothetical protein